MPKKELTFLPERLKQDSLGIKYSEDQNTFFDVTFHDSKIYENTTIAYLSWIQGKGSGIRLLGYIIEKLLIKSQRDGHNINLFIEPTTLDGSTFIEKLRGLGIKLVHEDSEVNWNCRGYSIEVKPEVLKLLASEA